MCGFFTCQVILHHQLDILQVNSVLTLSTWKLYLMPEVKSSLPQDRLLPHFRCQSQLQVMGASNRLSEVLQSSSDSINLLEQLPELRKTVYLLDYHFIIKWCNSETAGWKRYMGGKVCGRGCGASVPSSILPFSQHFYMFTNLGALNLILWEFLGGFVM